MTRLIQIQNGPQRRVALVEEPRVRLLAAQFPSVYALASVLLRARLSAKR